MAGVGHPPKTSLRCFGGASVNCFAFSTQPIGGNAVKRVFVSYSRHNQAAVGQLVHDLNAVGVQTWHDQALSGGQPWWDNILGNIRACDIFLFALSPESLESEACKSELAYVGQLGKPIIPMRCF